MVRGRNKISLLNICPPVNITILGLPADWVFSERPRWCFCASFGELKCLKREFKLWFFFTSLSLVSGYTCSLVVTLHLDLSVSSRPSVFLPKLESSSSVVLSKLHGIPTSPWWRWEPRKNGLSQSTRCFGFTPDHCWRELPHHWLIMTWHEVMAAELEKLARTNLPVSCFSQSAFSVCLFFLNSFLLALYITDKGHSKIWHGFVF